MGGRSRIRRWRHNQARLRHADHRHQDALALSHRALRHDRVFPAAGFRKIHGDAALRRNSRRNGLGGSADVFFQRCLSRIFKDLDLFAKAGGIGPAYVATVPLELTNAKLDVTFNANIENPEINPIEIIPAQM